MSENAQKPPAPAERLLKIFLKKYEYYEKLGDLQEVYYDLLEKDGIITRKEHQGKEYYQVTKQR